MIRKDLMRDAGAFTALALALALLGACVTPVLVGYDDAGAQGAATDGAPALCLQNPMFTGSPTEDGGIPRGSRTSARLPGWQICDGNADINPGPACTLPAPIGSTTYLGLDVGGFQGAGTSVSTPLSPSVPPGSYPFTIDLGLAIATLRRGFGITSSASVELRVYGSSGPCARDEELATIPPITNTDSWMTYSGTLTATKGFSNLVIVPSLVNAQGRPGGEAYVVIGNFVSQTCH